MPQAFAAPPPAPRPELAAATTFVEVLRDRAAAHPDRPAFTFLADGEEDGVALTYGELDRQARAIAVMLREACAPGDRAFLLFAPGQEFVAAFFGCLYAGVIAAPAYPPDPLRLSRSVPRLQSLVADAQASVVLTSSTLVAMATPVLAHAPALRAARWLAADTGPAAGAEERWQPPAADGGSIVLLQYTSGSTGTPKGVMVSHANLLREVRTVLAMYAARTAWSTAVSWLPQFHDAGLIGLTLLPLYAGVHTVILSPLAFLQRPVRWLRAITRFGAEISGGPNFAYDLCARKVTAEERATLDLGSWAAACNGAEPIHADTLERFAETFAPCGFRRSAFYPCWGLAEATLLLSAGTEAKPPLTRTVDRTRLTARDVVDADATSPRRRVLVGCGQPIPEHRLLVVDPETREELGPDRVGELWAAGPCVAQGYWQRPEETRETFQAFLRSGEGPFLRTGDLGFLHGGEVFITGRLKDVIVFRGRNYHPEDIETAVGRSHAALRPSCGAVFSTEVDGAERVVVVHEVRGVERRDLGGVMRAVRRAVADSHGLEVHAVSLLAAGTIPKTSSGKIQRHACREAFAAGRLEAVAEWRNGAAAVRPRR